MKWLNLALSRRVSFLDFISLEGSFLCYVLGVVIFHAGTKLVDGDIKTAGGRVFAVAAVCDSLESAVKLAYQGVESVKFKNMFYRKDIASR